MANYRLGQLVGSVAGLAWCTCLLVGLVECVLHISGLMGAVHEYRRLGTESRSSESWGSDGGFSWEGDASTDDSGLVLLIDFAVVISICLCQCMGLLLHWCLFIKPSPAKYLPILAGVPSDLQGKFKYGLFDCCGDLGTCCCFAWCPSCMMADYWYRAGWLHAAFGDQQLACPGWQWCMGVVSYSCGRHMASFCFPCCLSVLRGGPDVSGQGSGGKLGDIVPFRTRFGIEHHGFGTFVGDCCTWCWCSSCAGTQEYRQVMDLLDRGPVQCEVPPVPAVMVCNADPVLAPSAPPMVGPAIQLGAPVVQGHVVGSSEIV